MPKTETEHDPSWQLLESETPMVTVIRHHYRISLENKWNSKRVARLTNMLRCTKEELCALCGVFNKKLIQGYYEKNSWPMYLTLQFNDWEGFVGEHIMGAHPPLKPNDIMVAKLLLRAESRPKTPIQWNRGSRSNSPETKPLTVSEHG